MRPVRPRLSLSVTQPGRADPAGLRHVDHDVVRAVVLDLDVTAVAPSLSDSERGVHVVAGLRAGRLELLGDLLEALDLEADVVDAAPCLAALDAGHRVALEVQDGQVEVAVAQVVALRSGPVELGDLLHAEDVHVELGRPVHVLRRQRDVLDLWHGRLPSLPGMCAAPPRLAATLRQRAKKRQSWAEAPEALVRSPS